MSKCKYFLVLGFIFVLEASVSKEQVKRENTAQQIGGLIVDFFGPIYRDAFKEFLRDYEKQLRQFLEIGKFVPGSKLEKSYSEGRLPDKNASYLGLAPGYPGYYKELARRIDKKEIEEWEFYGVLSLATGMSEKEIKALMRAVEGKLNDDTCKLLRELKQKGLKIVFVANIEKPFLDKFLDYHDVRTIPDTILTSSETPGLVKPNLEFLAKAASGIGFPLAQLLYIDDSRDDIERVEKYCKLAGVIWYINIKQLREELAKFGI